MAELIPLDQIDYGYRLREVDDDWAAFIGASMADPRIGQMKPIEVRRMASGRFELVDGGHRLRAAHLNGWETVKAEIVDVDNLTARLREIDSQLVQRQLSALDHAAFLAERERIYVLLNPEAEGRKIGANARWHGTDTLSFASDAQEKLGITSRHIRRLLERHRRLQPDVRQRIVGTWLADHGAQLDQLSKLPPGIQREILDAMLRPENPAATVGDALKEIRCRWVSRVARSGWLLYKALSRSVAQPG